MQLACLICLILYLLLIFSIVASFVPSDFIPIGVSEQSAGTGVMLYCPFENVGNPIPNCTWSRIDSNNITHQLQLTGPKITSRSGNSYCTIDLVFTENDNGLYQCTGHNSVGNTTYTFPKRFVVESE